MKSPLLVLVLVLSLHTTFLAVEGAMQTIACVGDWLTCDACEMKRELGKEDKRTPGGYIDHFAKLLGYYGNWKVDVFTASDASVFASSSSSSSSLWAPAQTPASQSSMHTLMQNVLLSNASVFMVMLGANDEFILSTPTDPSPGYTEREQTFIAAYLALIKSIKDLPQTPAVYILVPPHTTEHPTSVGQRLRELVRQVATEAAEAAAAAGPEDANGRVHLVDVVDALNNQAFLRHSDNEKNRRQSRGGYAKLATVIAESLLSREERCSVKSSSRSALVPEAAREAGLHISVRYDSTPPMPTNSLLATGNIIYIKLPKCSSSTVSGIMRMMLYRNGRLGGPGDNYKSKPLFLDQHRPFFERENTLKDIINSSFIITWLRDPIERTMSSYYHLHIKRSFRDWTLDNKKKLEDYEPPGDLDKVKYLKDFRNFQLAYIAPHDVLQHIHREDLPQPHLDTQDEFKHNKLAPRDRAIKNPESITPLVEKALNRYNFVGSTNRFEESCVLLALQLNLTFCDVLSMKAKDSNDSERMRDVKFLPHTPWANESNAVKEFAGSEAYEEMNAYDVALYKALNKHLDEAVAKVGAREISKAVDHFKSLVAQVNAACKPGPQKYCLNNDAACAYACVERVCVQAQSCSLMTVRDWMKAQAP